MEWNLFTQVFIEHQLCAKHGAGMNKTGQVPMLMEFTVAIPLQCEGCYYR